MFFLIRLSFASFVNSVVKDVDVIRANSISQRLIHKNICELEGDVEVLIGNKMHVWAEYVEIDQEKKTVKARAAQNSFVKLEFTDTVILAEELFLNLESKKGFAKKVKIHLHEGFISSDYAEKVDDYTWKMKKITFTPCDHQVPHWAFSAQRATLHRNYFLRTSNVVFKVTDTPVFILPGLVVPIQRQAGSGFLIPRFSIDKEYGYGIKQDYYRLIGPRCDTTVGVNWVEKKGFAVSDEFRWARDAETRLTLKTQYAEEKNAFLEKHGEIVKATDKHYLIQGKYFQPFSVHSVKWSLLSRIDFGSRKRVGYNFFENASPEDSFYNSLIFRHSGDMGVVDCSVNLEKYRWRKYVGSESNGVDRKTIQENKVDLCYAPHIEWHSANKNFLDIFTYKHHFVVDYVTLSSRMLEKTYIDPFLDSTTLVEPAVSGDTARFFYEGNLLRTCRFKNQLLQFYCSPGLQVRSAVSTSDNSKKHSQFFVSCGAEWVMPELVRYNKSFSSMYFFQPVLNWKFVPHLNWSNWYYMDYLDRIYPQNQIELLFRNHWQKKDLSLDFHVSQAYDFNTNNELFYLQRAHNHKHLLPLRVGLNCGISNLGFEILQEYGLEKPELLQTSLHTTFNFNKFDFFIGALQQNKALQLERELLSDIPFFLITGASFPVGKKASFHYDGSFYVDEKCVFPIWHVVKPMSHRFSLDYKGHCWGLALGYEEKRYREYGNWKREHVITVAIKLNSLGSFAKRFKRPVIYRAPASYNPEL